jgi:hypothetical protein
MTNMFKSLRPNLDLFKLMDILPKNPFCFNLWTNLQESQETIVPKISHLEIDFHEHFKN